MKKLIAVLALALMSASAHAVRYVTHDDFEKLPRDQRAFCANNKAGGKIVLTLMNYGKDPASGKFVFSTNNVNNEPNEGRWVLVGAETVYVFWDNGTKSTFNSGGFAPCQL